MVFKLVRLVAIRCSFIFADVIAFLVSRLHIQAYTVQRIGVGKELCLQLWREIMRIAVVVCYAERALLIGEEGLGRLPACVPSVAVAHAGAYVEAIVVIGVCALGFPVVLVVIGAILTLAIAVDIAIHALTHGAVDIAVGVVCLTIYKLWVMVAQFACPDAEHIPLVGLVLCFCLSIPFVKESRFHLYVEHMVFLSVIVARMACQLRLTVVELQLACHFCRQLTYYLTAAEHVLAVHHQAYGLVIPEEFAVTVFHSRQFLYQFCKACSFLQFESLGVKHNGVAHHSDAGHLGCHFNFLQHECRG